MVWLPTALSLCTIARWPNERPHPGKARGSRGWGTVADLFRSCASPQSKTHQEQCILKSSLTSGPNFSVALNGQTRGTSS
jgi:hypothetical protein